MRIDRLERMASFLETLEIPANGEFRMRTWVANADGPECGTAACAIGWALTRDVFANDGLRMDYSMSRKRRFVPIYQGFSEYDAVAAFFEISVSQAMYLFGWDPKEPTFKHDVAERLRAFIAKYRPKDQTPSLRVVA